MAFAALGSSRAVEGGKDGLATARKAIASRGVGRWRLPPRAGRVLPDGGGFWAFLPRAGRALLEGGGLGSSCLERDVSYPEGGGFGEILPRAGRVLPISRTKATSKALRASMPLVVTSLHHTKVLHQSEISQNLSEALGRVPPQRRAARNFSPGRSSEIWHSRGAEQITHLPKHYAPARPLPPAKFKLDIPWHRALRQHVFCKKMHQPKFPQKFTEAAATLPPQRRAARNFYPGRSSEIRHSHATRRAAAGLAWRNCRRAILLTEIAAERRTCMG